MEGPSVVQAVGAVVVMSCEGHGCLPRKAGRSVIAHLLVSMAALTHNWSLPSLL